MQPDESMQEAESLLEDWIKHAVREAQEEVFGEDPRLEEKDMHRLSRINEALKEKEQRSLWGSVHYKIYTEEDDDGDEEVSIDTFGVPMIPTDLSSVDVDEGDRTTYNDMLSDYGVKVSTKVERQFEEWKSQRRKNG